MLVGEVAEAPDTARKPAGIRCQAALPVSFRRHPAVIDVHVDIPGVPEPLLHKSLDRVLDQALVDVHVKVIPGVKSHGRCRDQCLIDGHDVSSLI
jgi:hypothetical protein